MQVKGRRSCLCLRTPADWSPLFGSLPESPWPSPGASFPSAIVVVGFRPSLVVGVVSGAVVIPADTGCVDAVDGLGASEDKIFICMQNLLEQPTHLVLWLFGLVCRCNLKCWSNLLCFPLPAHLTWACWFLGPVSMMLTRDGFLVSIMAEVCDLRSRVVGSVVHGSGGKGDTSRFWTHTWDKWSSKEFLAVTF